MHSKSCMEMLTDNFLTLVLRIRVVGLPFVLLSFLLLVVGRGSRVQLRLRAVGSWRGRRGTRRVTTAVWTVVRSSAGLAVGRVVPLRVAVNKVPEEGMNDTQSRHLGLETHLLPESTDCKHRKNTRGSTRKQGHRFQ